MKKQRIDDIAMDQGSQNANMTKMRMNEMLMDQVVAVSCGTSRVCLSEERYEPSSN